MNIYALTNKNGEIEGTVVEFDNGKTVTSWEDETSPQSIAVWDSLADAEEIHIHRGGRTLDLISTLRYKA